MTSRVTFRMFASVALTFITGVARAQSPLPPDPQQTCTIAPADFAKWFASGSVTQNGVVLPANSVGFPNPPTLCDFYLWSWQMFLWLNSPAGTGHVFDSPLFYNVSGLSGAGMRTMTQNPALNLPRAIRRFDVRSAQLGNSRQILVKNAAGQLVDIGLGQAGSGTGVLMAQSKSLVYYEMQVNDVFAYFLTGQKQAGSPISGATMFPTTQAQVNVIEMFAGKQFQDGIALTMEVKTSWIELGDLDPTQYVTITATVPTFDTSSNTTWVHNGSKTVKLAMAGMHVVGSVQGHPEMIWATFEHVNTAPNASFTYTNAMGNNVIVPQNTAGNFLFCANNSAGPFNVARMNYLSAPNIVANTGQTIGPSDTTRANAWGGGPTTTANNTAIISLDNAILGLLANGDVRKNYLLVGATWTIGGVLPNGPTAPPVVGSTSLANSTMETYHQGAMSNCFTCHNIGGTVPAPAGLNGISHIYTRTSPLQ
jgi:hypothetical protein